MTARSSDLGPRGFQRWGNFSAGSSVDRATSRLQSNLCDITPSIWWPALFSTRR